MVLKRAMSLLLVPEDDGPPVVGTLCVIFFVLQPLAASHGGVAMQSARVIRRAMGKGLIFFFQDESH